MAQSAMSRDDKLELPENKDSSVAIGELLQVRMSDDPNSPTYRSRVDDMLEKKLVIAWPTHEGVRLIAHRDQLLDFYLVRDGDPHEFTGLVDEVQSGPLPQLTIIQSSAIVKVQRRQNFRIRCLVPIAVVGSIAEGGEENSTSLFLKTTTCDISAGGMSFIHMKQIREGTLLEVKVSLPDNGPVIKIPCRVVHSDISADSHVMYRTGLQYLAITESERARIVRYVYRTQLKGLRD